MNSARNTFAWRVALFVAICLVILAVFGRGRGKDSLQLNLGMPRRIVHQSPRQRLSYITDNIAKMLSSQPAKHLVLHVAIAMVVAAFIHGRWPKLPSQQ
jgi:hypothetical protein